MGVIDNGYVGLASLRGAIQEQSDVTAHDAELERVIAAASRQIDDATGRRFYVATATRYVTASRRDRIELGDGRESWDLLAVTALDTDHDGDRTYEVGWASTDWDGVPYGSPPWYALEVAPRGTRSFPAGVRGGVRIAGRWGYSEATESLGTLAAAMDATTTAMDLAAAAGEVGDRLLVDAEQMLVTAVAGSTLTVSRAYNGTTAASHASGAAVLRYVVPAPVRQACLLQAVRLYRRRDAAFGVLGGVEWGGVRVSTVDPDVRVLLAPYRLARVA